MKVASFAAIAGGLFALAGCATETDTTAGVTPLLMDNQLQFLDIGELIRAQAKNGSATAPPSPESLTTEQSRSALMTASKSEDQQIAEAIASFYSVWDPDKKQSDQTLALLRNEIQDQIIAASNQRCHQWKLFFANSAENFSFAATTAGTVTSAMGTALTRTGAKSIASAATSIFTGANSNFSDAYLQTKTISVIFQGIDTRRQNILNNIVTLRFHAGQNGAEGAPAPLTEYSLSRAIADALEYHAACSVQSGLQQASEAMAQAPSAPAPQVTPPPTDQDLKKPPKGGAKTALILRCPSLGPTPTRSPAMVPAIPAC